MPTSKNAPGSDAIAGDAKPPAPLFPSEECVEKKWLHRGLWCVVARHDLGGERTTLKHRCGYVCVPKSSSWYGENYDDLPAQVHGGLTYGEFNVSKDFWIGFDCAHMGDSSFPPGDPDGKNYGSLARGHYWSLEEVKHETERLADQVLAL